MKKKLEMDSEVKRNVWTLFQVQRDFHFRNQGKMKTKTVVTSPVVFHCECDLFASIHYNYRDEEVISKGYINEISLLTWSLSLSTSSSLAAAAHVSFLCSFRAGLYDILSYTCRAGRLNIAESLAFPDRCLRIC